MRVLRNVLLESGYSVAGANESVLGDLFLRGVAVNRRFVADAVAPLSPTDLSEMGLCVIRGDRVHPKVSLEPHDGLILAGDPPGGRRDQVGGVSRAGITLSYLTVRKEAVSTLDLGTGCGLQALLSAGHSSQVTATDVNRRALRFAAFNAALNNIANVEFRQGSWFEPVRGRTFDLIVANPPYVISPDTTFVYRDSALPGDEVCRRLVREAPAHLTENGTATILCNWVHARDEPWWDPVTDWVRESGCDALLLHYASDDPIEYARRWNQHLSDVDRAQYDQVQYRWCSYYREQGIGAIASGAVVLRRRTGSNWVRTLTAAEGPSGPAGEQILRLLAAHDHLTRNDREEALLHKRFALVEGHTLEQTLTYRGGEYVNHPAAVRLFSGLGAQAEIDPRAVHLLLACDPDATLGDIIDRVADQLDIDFDELAQLALHAFRALLEHGLLEVVGADCNRPRGLPQTTVGPA